ncbi:hypothetical protein Premu_1953 [Hallella multisaccharivorax DSM 17128]|uniref:Uncharacterized protein n=1 Tax=Hallella multisaccharivorax DSM 17128 TaxID=688246 RepID=F8N737_9BACT|nr:hypothetical protein Premu_1953 [Hallella multisaccharivorax DSM 17128]
MIYLNSKLYPTYNKKEYADNYSKNTIPTLKEGKYEE